VRRSLWLAATLGTVLLAAGCGAGQISQTADMQPVVPGANSTATPGSNPSIQLRNVLITYPGVNGYRAGAVASLELSIFNTGERPVTLVRVTTDAARTVTQRGTVAANPAPTDSPTAASLPGDGPVRLTVPAENYVTLARTAGAWLQLNSLTRDLLPGESASIEFAFDNGASYKLDVPVGLPDQPVQPGSPVAGEGHE
jgi:hypothetical protein